MNSRSFFEFDLTPRGSNSFYVEYDMEFLGFVEIDANGAQAFLLIGKALQSQTTLRAACRVLLEWWTADEEEQKTFFLSQNAA